MIERKRQVAVIGPVTPFRSGVAKHTTELAMALADRVDVSVKVYSFFRQYPKWLFPGASDLDTDAGPPQQLEVEYSIDSLNPFTWRRVVGRIKQQGVTEVVMPAWTFFLAPCLGWVARRCRAEGMSVIMMVHNVLDHEESSWKSWLSEFQMRQASRFITHGQALATRLAESYGGVPITVRPHPIFEQYPEPEGRLSRRAALELLFFGLVRKYKGLEIALRGVAASCNPDIRLTVVGEFWEGLQQTRALIDNLGLHDQVELVPRYVSDAEAAEYFFRADAVVLPYRTVTGSGVVPVAYRYGKPVIVTDLVTAQSACTMRDHIARKREEMSWSAFADAVLEPE